MFEFVRPVKSLLYTIVWFSALVIEPVLEGRVRQRLVSQAQRSRRTHLSWGNGVFKTQETKSAAGRHRHARLKGLVDPSDKAGTRVVSS